MSLFLLGPLTLNNILRHLKLNKINYDPCSWSYGLLDMLPMLWTLLNYVWTILSLCLMDLFETFMILDMDYEF